MMDEDDDDARVITVAGYERPQVKCHRASDDETLRRLAQNDPNIEGLSLCLDDNSLDATITIMCVN